VGLYSYQIKAEKYENITRQLLDHRIDEMILEAEVEVFLDEKTCTVDEKTEGNELQKELGLIRILTKREEALVIGLFKVLPTG
jgi:hypothetical protein